MTKTQLRKANAAIQRHAIEARESRLSYKSRRTLMLNERAAGKKARRRRSDQGDVFDADTWEEGSCPTPARARYLERQRYRARKYLPELLAAYTAVDLDEEGRKLVYNNAILGPNKEQWERAGGQEIIRLFESHTGRLIRVGDIPKGRVATNYIEKALRRFGLLDPKGANSPTVYVPPEYGKQVQYEEIDDTSPVSPASKTRIQEIVGVFLFYARAVDPTMLTAVNKLASKQANPTESVVAASERLMQYAARFPDATIEIRPSDMQLMCHSDASYLSEQNSRSRAGGILFLGDPNLTQGLNGAIDCISVIISTVVASAAEADYVALFIVGREAVSASATLTDMGYPQTATLIICDNQCAVGIANRTVKQKQTKAISVRYHWTRDRVATDELRIQWRPGKENLADFFTKTHPVHHHLAQRQVYVQDANPYSCLSDTEP